MKSDGFVSLVGAGPGDAELLTVKAMRLLQSAEVVLYDRLVSDEILNLIPTGVSRISVGKSVGHHCVPQEMINETLVNLARAGHRIVRLKGGDPYLFGRGSEEALVLQQHGIPFQIVPGVTAASGGSAYSGIPLTHRGKSRRVQFITGHFKDDEALDINWDKVADPDSTLVIYMGLQNIQHITQSLIQAGLSEDTPSAAIQNATSQNQRRVITRLSELAEVISTEQLTAPVLIIIGEVVSLSEKLDWFGQNFPDDQVVPYEIPQVLVS
jgi:uroporphyrin-III C-methyltransferase